MNDLDFALHLADLADAITMAKYQAADLIVNQKPDLTPVTEADQSVERELRSAIVRDFPGDAILGEEYGVTPGSDAPLRVGNTPLRVGNTPLSGGVTPLSGGNTPLSGGVTGDDAKARTWIIDPIDGTKNFVRGVPVWATLIALAEGSSITVGVVSAPALGRRWWAASGRGAWVATQPALTPLAGSPRKLCVSQVADLAHASFAYASLDGWSARGKLPAFLELASKCWRTRGYGDFWIYMLLAEGAVDLAAEPELEVYDMAALVPIITEAGGRFTSLDGRPGPWGGNAIASNGILHDAGLKYLGNNE